MKQATYFIEMIRIKGCNEKYSRPTPMKLFTWSMEVNRNQNIETIAIFKIYPKIKNIPA